MSNPTENGISLTTCDLLQIIDNLENKSYLKPNFNGLLTTDNMKIKIEQFTNWLNSTFRINILKENIDNELYLFLLLNLKKSIKSAIGEINKSTNRQYKFKCNKCNLKIDIDDNNGNFWDCIQEHEHCEETFLEGFDSDNISNNIEITAPTTSINDAKMPINNINSTPAVSKTITNNNNNNNKKPPGLNDFKFNFTIKYDSAIESNYYPEGLMATTRDLNKSTEYIIQRSGVNRAACLLCPCPITTKGKQSKISSYLLKVHVSGQKHLKCASDNKHLINLKKYHDFWKEQDFKYQSHQVYFFPQFFKQTTPTIRCHLCNASVLYENIIEHIKNDVHKTNFIKWISSEEGRNSRLYLIQIQMSVYCKTENMNGHMAMGSQPEVSTVKAPPPTTTKTIAAASGTATTKKTAPPKKNKGNERKQKDLLQYCTVVKSELGFTKDGKLTLPDRFNKHEEFFIKINNETIKCNLCKIEFMCDLKTISLHIRTNPHKQLSKINGKTYRYFCEICNVSYNDEDSFDNHFSKGPNRHGLIAENRKAHLTFYECRTCSLVFYGDDMSINRHLTSASRANKKKDDVKLPYKIKRLFTSEASIEDEAKRLVHDADQVLKCNDRMKECCNDLEKALNQLFPNCKAYAFGSRVSGAGNINSDLDVFMDIGDMYTGNIKQDADSQEVIIIKSAKLLRANKDDFSEVFPIPAARTPIIKLHHNFTNLDCDISFRHGLGVENTKFLRFCMELQPITQPFILLLKKWSEECRLKEYITNYAFALMAIFYLQISGYLLPVKVLREFNPHPSAIIDGWETMNYTVPVEKMKEFVKPCTLSVKQLLKDFFNYFVHFNYSNDVVCPLMGETVPKMSFCEQPDKRLPLEMKTYLRKIQTIEDAEQFRALSPFCIQDPFDLSHNLTKACPNSMVTKFKALCKVTCEKLTIEME